MLLTGPRIAKTGWTALVVKVRFHRPMPRLGAPGEANIKLALVEKILLPIPMIAITTTKLARQTSPSSRRSTSSKDITPSGGGARAGVAEGVADVAAQAFL